MCIGLHSNGQLVRQMVEWFPHAKGDAHTPLQQLKSALPPPVAKLLTRRLLTVRKRKVRVPQGALASNQFRLALMCDSLMQVCIMDPGPNANQPCPEHYPTRTRTRT